MGSDRAAGTKNASGGIFSSCIVDRTMESGRGRDLEPADVVVSTLDTSLDDQEMVMNCTYQI
jgi:hypothetical protein